MFDLAQMLHDATLPWGSAQGAQLLPVLNWRLLTCKAILHWLVPLNWRWVYGHECIVCVAECTFLFVLYLLGQAPTPIPDTSFDKWLGYWIKNKSILPWLLISMLSSNIEQNLLLFTTLLFKPHITWKQKQPMRYLFDCFNRTNKTVHTSKNNSWCF